MEEKQTEGEQAPLADSLPSEDQETVAHIKAQADAYLDLAQRVQADFLNFKRRVERERSDDQIAARAELLSKLLPVVDDFERAEAFVPVQLRDEAWAQGVLLAMRNLRALLVAAGLERLDPAGEVFDPRLHEATAYEFNGQLAEGRVAEVTRPGYRLGERVLRPAQVVVSRGVASANSRAGEKSTGRGRAPAARRDVNGATSGGDE